MKTRTRILKTLKHDEFQELERRKHIYREITSPRAQDKIRTERFNDLWQAAQAQHPFYRFWSKHYKLPATIGHIEEVGQFPKLTKNALREYDDLIFADTGDRTSYMSGGTTGAPMHFPRGADESLDRWVNMYTCRSWLGIEPGDTYLHPWGHSHLFGAGHKAQIKKLMRASKDSVSGGYRVSGYDRSPEAFQSSYNKLIQVQPKYIIGYASYIAQMAHHMTMKGLTPPSRLSWVIPTSESITPEERQAIKSAFRCHVGDEYGAIETGVIAHTHPNTMRLQVPWYSFYINCTGLTNGTQVTTLDKRRFPLINYSLEDSLLAPDDPDNVRSLDGVAGRVNGNFKVATKNGNCTDVSYAHFQSILNKVPGVTQIQFAQKSASNIHIIVTTPTLDWDQSSIFTFLKDSLSKTRSTIDPNAISVELRTRPILTTAGKAPHFLPENYETRFRAINE